MTTPIEDYALIGDCHTAALVSRAGSIDWLCLPRYDSASMFGALLGTADNGRWSLAPADEVLTTTRSYAGDSFVLVTRHECATGVVEVIDAMPVGDRRADVLRRVRGIEGTVAMHQEYVVRFGYGAVMPWVRRVSEADGGQALVASAGPDAVVLRASIALPEARGHRHVSDFTVAAGEEVDLVMTWYPSHREPPPPVDASTRLVQTEQWWQDWADRGSLPEDHRGAVLRSLLVLRALTHEDTGGIVAAATTSLPELPGGTRNWDYRYCWLRDAALTLEALMGNGYHDEAREWRDWLLRAVAGSPDDVQIMYGVAGERDLLERELDHLPGYGGARPVRIGNGAVGQYQADVLGEVLVALDAARRGGIAEDQFSWPLQRALLDSVERNWKRKDSGIWEMRGAEQHFVHSRVMVWAALDRGISAVEDFGLDGPAERWEELREEVEREVLTRGIDPERGCFVQHYGTREVDASLLQLPAVGFIAADDPTMLATVRAVEEDLMVDGLVMRYRTAGSHDGLPPGEHPFLTCSFWLVEQYARSGRDADARALMDRLVSLANDVGLLSEEYDTEHRRHLGNTPQALSHLALVRAAGVLGSAVDDDVDR